MRLYLSSFHLGNHPAKFAEMIQGDKNTAIILNARDYFPAEDREAGRLQQIENLNRIGIKGSEIDLRKYFGRQEELKTVMNDFDAVWIPGGNVFLLRHAMKMSGFDEILVQLIREDKIAYGGYSAGIVVLSETLEGLDIVDDIKYVKKMYNEQPIWNGLGILPYSIAPHYKSNHPETDLIDELVMYYIDNNIKYITLKDGQAIVINGDKEELVE
ncbi:MAG: Type 1 glutamine amidotransferase-like domain-containing protein [Bacteroidetes bacterium]|nr:Type 1 glutamine amidotransferase-like domain-containing protein [Bacteroidota bacterium]